MKTFRKYFSRYINDAARLLSVLCPLILITGCGEDEPGVTPVGPPVEHTGVIDVVLPDHIYCVVGHPLQLFYRGMIGAVDPYRYDILVQCSHGKKFPRYFEFTPAAEDIGDIPFSVTVRDDNGNILGSASTVIRVVAEKCEADLNLLTFGDSLTGGGVWCNHADSQLPGNVHFCGSREYNGTHYFGIGGWNWSSYTTAGQPGVRFEVKDVDFLSVGAVYKCRKGIHYTVQEINVTGDRGNVLMRVSHRSDVPDTKSGTLTKVSGYGSPTLTYTSYSQDSANPLWAGNRMTFRPYVEKYAGGRVDLVYVLLGWNDVIPWQTDFSQLTSTARQFFHTLNSEYPEARLYIMGLQIPSLNGGIGNSYGASGEGYADGYGLCRTVLNLNKAYQQLADDLGERVEFINISCQFDSENNMPAVEIPVNQYNPATELIGTNGLHPNIYGYYQIGDAVVRSVYGLR